jgi:hypothetical protein
VSIRAVARQDVKRAQPLLTARQGNDAILLGDLIRNARSHTAEAQPPKNLTMSQRLRCWNILDIAEVGRAVPRISRSGLLGGALSAAALAAILLPGHASAQSKLIDDFSVGQPRVSSTTNGTEKSSISLLCALA